MIVAAIFTLSRMIDPLIGTLASFEPRLPTPLAGVLRPPHTSGPQGPSGVWKDIGGMLKNNNTSTLKEVEEPPEKKGRQKTTEEGKAPEEGEGGDDPRFRLDHAAMLWEVEMSTGPRVQSQFSRFVDKQVADVSTARRDTVDEQ